MSQCVCAYFCASTCAWDCSGLWHALTSPASHDEVEHSAATLRERRLPQHRYAASDRSGGAVPKPNDHLRCGSLAEYVDIYMDYILSGGSYRSSAKNDLFCIDLGTLSLSLSFSHSLLI